jgi:DNA-binding PucR family transcriptional regulator
LLARAAETPHAKELIHPGLPKLFALQSKESLVQTLEAYLDNGCDTKLTAEALFLHRASLYYRLQRIEAITGTTLKSGATGSHCTPASNWRAWWAYIRR